MPRLSRVLLICLLCLTSCNRTPPRDDFAAFTDHFDSQLGTVIERHGIPGAAVALVHDGAVAWTAEYGLANTASGDPITERTAEGARRQAAGLGRCTWQRGRTISANGAWSTR